MPRTNREALDAIADVAAAQRGLVTAAQFAEIGLARTTIRHRARQGGPWERVLPGMYLVARGPMSLDQRRMAALLFAGTTSALTGVGALQLYGVKAVERLSDDPVHVLVPHRRKRTSAGFVLIERTVHWPKTVTVEGNPVAPLPRAAIDATRRLRSRRDVDALLSELVQSGRVTLDELEDVLRTSQRQQTALARDAIKALRRGPASAPEIDLFHRWTTEELPDALWNADLLAPDGTFLARPDVYLTDYGIAFEVDSAAHHSSRDDWERTMARHSSMTSYGVLVMHASPHRIAASWPAVLRELRRAIDSREGHPGLAVICQPRRVA